MDVADNVFGHAAVNEPVVIPPPAPIAAAASSAICCWLYCRAWGDYVALVLFHSAHAGPARGGIFRDMAGSARRFAVGDVFRLWRWLGRSKRIVSQSGPWRSRRGSPYSDNWLPLLSIRRGRSWRGRCGAALC